MTAIPRWRMPGRWPARADRRRGTPETSPARAVRGTKWAGDHEHRRRRGSLVREELSGELDGLVTVERAAAVVRLLPRCTGRLPSWRKDGGVLSFLEWHASHCCLGSQLFQRA